MFDIQESNRDSIKTRVARGPLDAAALMDAIAAMSKAELAELEDDLDFAQFTGVQSSRIQALVADVTRAERNAA